MKHYIPRLFSIFSLAALLLLISCGAPRQAGSADADTHDLGIAKVSKRSSTSSVGEVERDKTMDDSNLSLIDMLRRVPGVVIAGNNSITIRGATSMYSSNEPLFVVDGVVVGEGYDSVSSLNPNDVDRISVLKGTSAGIYGSRGANGVIIIKTKDGQLDKNRKN